MSLLTRLGLAFLLSAALLPQASARDEAPPVAAQGTVSFASGEGIGRLARAAGSVNFAALANQFEAQSNVAFCGPTTAAIVLNAVRARAPDLPRDASRLRPEDLRLLPPGFDLTVPRFTQDSVIAKGQKSRAQVLGEPIVVNGKPVRDGGYQLRQFDEMLRANGLATKVVVVDDQKPDAEIRADLTGQLQRPGGYVIVNYRREAVGQQGGGHISPLGAYDEASDSVLVMDVNPATAGWVWMPMAVLIRGMRTFDTVENRGYVLVLPG